MFFFEIKNLIAYVLAEGNCVKQCISFNVFPHVSSPLGSNEDVVCMPTVSNDFLRSTVFTRDSIMLQRVYATPMRLLSAQYECSRQRAPPVKGPEVNCWRCKHSIANDEFCDQREVDKLYIRRNQVRTAEQKSERGLDTKTAHETKQPKRRANTGYSPPKRLILKPMSKKAQTKTAHKFSICPDSTMVHIA